MSKGIPFKDRSNKSKDISIIDLKYFISLFEREFNLPLYLMYGTLLGAVRQGDFIPKDNDIDLAYVSRYRSLPEVFSEMLGLYDCLDKMSLLIDRGEGGGFSKNCGHAHVFCEDKRSKFDIWTSWIGEDGKYYFWSMGMGLPEAHLLPLAEVPLRGTDFKVPHKYKKVLEYLYGKDWTVEKSLKSHHYRSDSLDPINKLAEVGKNES